MATHQPLTVELLLAAYASGYFPMADPPPPAARASGRFGRARRVRWYSPDPRAVLPLEAGGLHVPRSLARTMRRRPFALTSDRAFREVITACAAPGPGRGESWISDEMIEAYTGLHEAGHAHSVEAWRAGVLVGGIYGVSIGAAFFAESMFSRPELGGTDASKVCLVALTRHASACRYEILDVQIANPHTERFGVVECGRVEFLKRLTRAVGGCERWVAMSDAGAENLAEGRPGFEHP